MQIILLIVCVWILTMCVNWLICEWADLELKDKPFKFITLYLLLSPFTLFGSINQAFVYWAERIEDQQTIVQQIQMALEGSKYEGMSPTDIAALGHKVAQYLLDVDYFDCDDKEWTILGVFERFEEEGIIFKDENGYHASDLTK